MFRSEWGDPIRTPGVRCENDCPRINGTPRYSTMRKEAQPARIRSHRRAVVRPLNFLLFSNRKFRFAPGRVLNFFVELSRWTGTQNNFVWSSWDRDNGVWSESRFLIRHMRSSEKCQWIISHPYTLLYSPGKAGLCLKSEGLVLSLEVVQSLTLCQHHRHNGPM
jgi:hypothetical protein